MDIFDIFVENRAFLSIFMLSQGFLKYLANRKNIIIKDDIGDNWRIKRNYYEFNKNWIYENTYNKNYEDPEF